MKTKEIERVAKRLKQRFQGTDVNRQPGAVQRFVVRNAKVEMSFRKERVTADEVATVLMRAAEMARIQQ